MRGSNLLRQLIYAPVVTTLKNAITRKRIEVLEEVVEPKDQVNEINTVGKFIKALTDLCCVSKNIGCIIYNTDDIINYSRTVDYPHFDLFGYLDNDDGTLNVHWKRINLNDPNTWKKYADLPLVKSIHLKLKDGWEFDMNTGIRFTDEYGEDADFEILTRNMNDYEY